jgi:hypothetical protein
LLVVVVVKVRGVQEMQPVVREVLDWEMEEQVEMQVRVAVPVQAVVVVVVQGL